MLQIYDTRRREKVEFSTIESGKVKMYVCGITPYSPSHLGHARCYVSFDIVHRWLESKGYDVHYVQNFTDIDDKIINKANERGMDFLEVANENIENYYDCMDKLNVLRADVYPRVTEYIDNIIEMIDRLLDNGNAYVADDGVYFHIESAPDKYGQLTGQNIESVRAGAGGRVDNTGSCKKDHKDFALWKFSKPDEPKWESPWGDGRPGWHIECSAMSIDLLGHQFDIHGGGHDLRFPHHEAEIFQGECYTGIEPIVNWWMHNGFVNVDGEKMSKSLGNFWTISDALRNYSGLVIRHALLNAQYRNPIDLSEQFLEDGKKSQQRLVEVYRRSLEAWNNVSEDSLCALPNGDLSSDDLLIKSLGLIEKMSESFAVAMDDDFNTRTALSKLSGVIREINRVLDSNEIQNDDKESFGWYSVILLEELAGSVLGLLPGRNDAMSDDEDEEKSARRQEIAEKVEALLERRTSARESKNWGEADSIRDELNEMGVVVEDTPDGPVWKII